MRASSDRRWQRERGIRLLVAHRSKPARAARDQASAEIRRRSDRDVTPCSSRTSPTTIDANWGYARSLPTASPTGARDKIAKRDRRCSPEATLHLPGDRHQVTRRRQPVQACELLGAHRTAASTGARPSAGPARFPFPTQSVPARGPCASCSAPVGIHAEIGNASRRYFLNVRRQRPGSKTPSAGHVQPTPLHAPAGVVRSPGFAAEVPLGGLRLMAS